MSVSALLGGGSFQGDDHIKSQMTFAQYYAGFGFFGGLSTLTVDEMYLLKVAAATQISVTGTPVALPKTLTINEGWSWIPSPYQTAVSLSDGIPSYNYVQGDHIKSQMQFSEFYSGYGWFGSLSMLNPGEGYKLRVSSGGPATF